MLNNKVAAKIWHDFLVLTDFLIAPKYHEELQFRYFGWNDERCLINKNTGVVRQRTSIKWAGVVADTHSPDINQAAKYGKWEFTEKNTVIVQPYYIIKCSFNKIRRVTLILIMTSKNSWSDVIFFFLLILKSNFFFLRIIFHYFLYYHRWK